MFVVYGIRKKSDRVTKHPCIWAISIERHGEIIPVCMAAVQLTYLPNLPYLGQLMFLFMKRKRAYGGKGEKC